MTGEEGCCWVTRLQACGKQGRSCGQGDGPLPLEILMRTRGWPCPIHLWPSPCCHHSNGTGKDPGVLGGSQMGPGPCPLGHGPLGKEPQATPAIGLSCSPKGQSLVRRACSSGPASSTAEFPNHWVLSSPTLSAIRPSCEGTSAQPGRALGPGFLKEGRCHP